METEQDLPMNIPNQVILAFRRYRRRAIELQRLFDQAMAVGQLCPKCFHRASKNKRIQKNDTTVQYFRCTNCDNAFQREVKRLGSHREDQEELPGLRSVPLGLGSGLDESNGHDQRSSALASVESVPNVESCSM